MTTVGLVTNIPTPYRVSFYNTLATCLAESGAQLHVLYCAASEPGRSWQVSLDDTAFTYEFLSGRNVRLGEANMHVNPGVTKRLNEVKPDAVVIGSYSRPTSQLARMWCRRNKVRHLLWFESNETSGRLRGRALVPVRRQLLQNFDAYLVPGELSATLLRRWIGARVRTVHVPNTIDVDSLRRALERPLPRPHPQRHRLVYVGQLIPRKGVLELVEYCVGRPGVDLDVVGEGPLRGELERCIRSVDNVQLLGGQPSDEAMRIMATGDAVVVPSLRDPSPLVTVEALAMGRPLLLSPFVGNGPECLDRGRNGCEIDPSTPETLRADLERFLSLSANDRDQMGVRSRSIYESRFDIGLIAERLARVCLEDA